MNKENLLLLLLLTISTYSYAQYNSNDSHRFIDDVRFGGAINMSFGNTYSTFTIAPSAVYDFSETFGAGLGFKYVYVKNKGTIERTTNLIGGSAIALFKPIHYLQFSTEYELLRVNQNYANSFEVDRWQPALYIGLEYVSGNLAMGLRYDVLFDRHTNLLYSSAVSPVFRIYF